MDLFKRKEPQSALSRDGVKETKGLGNDDEVFSLKYPLRILIADGNDASGRAVNLMLESFGYEFDSVENGEKCLKIAETKTHDLILMDLDNLPIRDGAECTYSIREAKIETPVFALTAFPPEVARLQNMGAGFSGYLQKPLKSDDVKQVLRMAYLSSVFTGSSAT